MEKKLLSVFFALSLFFLNPFNGFGQCPTSVSISANPGSKICEGTEVTFTASPNGGTGTFSYQWKRGGTTISGNNSTIYGPITPINGETISVVVTSSDDPGGCSTTGSIKMTVNAKRTGSVTIQSNNTNICLGETVNFSISNISNAGSGAIYNWEVNGNPAGTNSTSFSTNSLSNNDKVTLTVQSTVPCTADFTSNEINITEKQPATISSPSNKDQTICINSALNTISFSIGGDGSGATVSGLPPGVTGNYNSGTYTISGTPTTANTFNYTITTTGSCSSLQTSQTGSSITVQEDASISLTSGSTSQSICQNENIENIVYTVGGSANGGNVSGLPSGISGIFANGKLTISGSSNSTGTFNYTATATGPCASAALTGSITINQNLTPSISIASNDSDNTICEGTSVTFTATPTNGGNSPSYQWKVDGSNAGTNSSTFTTTSLSNGQQVTVEMTPSSEICVTSSTAISNEIKTTVNPNLTPSVTIASSDDDNSICDGSSVTFTASPTNGGSSPTYQWQVNGNNAGTGNIFTTTSLKNGDNVKVIMTTSETCVSSATATSNTIPIKVDNSITSLTPTFISDPNKNRTSVCPVVSGLIYEINPVAGATSYVWTVPSGWTITANGTTNSITVKATGTATSGDITVSAKNECGNSKVATLPVSTGNFAYASAGPDQTVCAGTTSITLAGEIGGAITKNNQWIWSANGGSFSGGGHDLTGTYSLPTSIQNGGTVTITITTDDPAGSCDRAIDSMVITVLPPTSISNPSNKSQTVCINTAIAPINFNINSGATGATISGLPAGVTGAYNSGVFTISGTPTASGTFAYTVNTTGNCTKPSQSGTITVTPNPTISNPSNKDQTICINSAIANINFNITNPGTGATVTGLPTGVSGSFSSGTFTIKGTPTVSGSFPYTVTTTGSCSQVSQSGTITVTPDPTITNPANKDQTICINNAIANIAFNITNPGNGATVTGLPTGVSGSFSGGTFTIKGTPTVSGSFPYTVTTTGNCSQVSQSGTITVTPDPTISDPSNKVQTICINSAIANIAFNITDPGTGATITGLPTGVSGNFSSGTFTITGTPTVSGSFPYTVTTTGNCSQVSRSGTITVTPDPTISDPSNKNQTICIGTAITDIAFDITDPGTGATVTGLPAGVNGNFSNGTFTIKGTPTVPGSFPYTVTTTGSCSQVSQSGTITINEQATVGVSSDLTICSSGSVALEGATVGGGASTAAWEIISGQGSLSSTTQTGNPETVTYTPPSNFNGTVVLRLTSNDPAGPCDAVSKDLTIHINKEVRITTEPYNVAVCTANSATLEVAATGDNLSYQWYKGTEPGTAINGATSSTLTINNATTADDGIYYVVVSGENSCASVKSDEVTLNVDENIVVNTQPVSQDLCEGGTLDLSVAATATGGEPQYQWRKNGNPISDGGNISGATTGNLSITNVSSADDGDYDVVIDGPDGYTCDTGYSAIATISVNPPPISEAGADFQACSTNSAISLKGTDATVSNYTSLEWTTSNGAGTITNAASLDATYEPATSDYNKDIEFTLTAIFEVNGNQPCSAAVSIKNITILPLPEITSFSYAGTEFCQTDTQTQAPTLTGNYFDTSAGIYSVSPSSGLNLDSSTGVITPNGSTPGDYTITYTAPSNGICTETVTASYDISIGKKPVADFSYAGSPYCSNAANPSPTLASGSIAGIFNSTSGLVFKDDTTGEIDIAASTPGDYTVTNTIASSGGCAEVTATADITITKLPVATFSYAGSPYCSDGSNPTVSLDVVNGAEAGIFTADSENLVFKDNATGEIDIAASLPGTYTVTNTFDAANGCSEVTATADITITKLPDATFSYSKTAYCISEGSATVNTDFQSGGVFSSTDLGSHLNASTGKITWTNTDNITGSHTITYTITGTGGCGDVINQVTISIDPLPVGGELNFSGFGRILESCSNPGPDYSIPIELTGHQGTIARWRYKEGSDIEWTTINHTGSTLTPDIIRGLGINESTIFEVEMTNGGCNTGIFSQSATLSIISSDIAPNPVTVAPGVVCTGDEITLTASSGYGSGAGFEEGGVFDFSSITNHGWRIKNSVGVESNFDSSADNGVAAIWLRTNPLPLSTASLNSPFPVSSKNWDSSAGNEGNKGFAIVSGPNPSTLETSVFNLFAIENPILTFDQAYNLTPGSAIYVEISTDGGANYQPVPLFELIATNPTDGTSGNYASFGDGDITSRPKNKIELDLTAYAGLDNLRVMFRYEGTRPGDVWAVDAISLPVEPTGVDMIWTDYTDPDNPVIIGNNNSEQWKPTLIGWNDFEIRTRLIFDSTGAICPVVENFSTIKVFVFDSYKSTATAKVGSCGDLSAHLKAEVVGGAQGGISTFPTDDGYTAKWEVVNAPTGFVASDSYFSTTSTSLAAINDPQAVFTPNVQGAYTLRYELTPTTKDGNLIQNTGCPPTYVDVPFDIKDCTTLDFDGVDDYVDLGTGYTGDYSIEAWILPFDRTKVDGTKTDASKGTIISTSNLEINMSDLSGLVSTNGRWYHIAVDNDGVLYVDGIDSGKTISKTGTERSFIGARWNAPNASNHFSGWIEEVRIWKGKISEKNIRFTMNQRLKSTGNIGVEVDMSHPDAPVFGSLAGYYQLIATNILNGGYTPNLAGTVNGKLRNMETLQENTAPLPYTSGANGNWSDRKTWTQPVVWDFPNSTGVDDTPIDWNIVRTSHDISSGAKDITVLGLISETGELNIKDPGSSDDEYNLGQFLRVTHYLKLDGVIDLEGESQLLQDSGSILDEASAGYLERDQQGKRNSFVYNYWSSPVSPQGGAANNAPYSVESVLMDGTNPLLPAGINFQPEYWAADGGRTSPEITISTYWLWTYRHAPANIYALWEYIGKTIPIETGEGFTMKGTDGTVAGVTLEQNYTFRGKPHNGDFDLSMAAGQNYLIGNPYPSAFDGHEFIRNNIKDGGNNETNVFDGALYFWDHFKEVDHILKEYIGGYAVLNLASPVGIPAYSIDDRINNDDPTLSGNKPPKQNIPVGQAFLINSTGTSGGEIHFKNSQRTFKREAIPADNSIFLEPEIVIKTGKEKTTEAIRIRLSFKSPVGYHRQILVGAISSTTNGFDLGYDALLFDDNAEDMYWMQADNQLVIQGVPNFDKDQVLPLGVKIKENKEFRIRIDTLENAPAEMKVYLNDKLKDSIHDLKAGPYVSTSEPGYIHDRFEIIFFKEEPPVIEGPIVGVPGEEGPVIEVPDTDFTTLSVKHAYNLREIQIMNPDKLIISSVYLFDLNGNLIESYTNIPQDKEINLRVRNYSSGVYLLKVYAEGKIISKKIIISN